MCRGGGIEKGFASQVGAKTSQDKRGAGQHGTFNLRLAGLDDMLEDVGGLLDGGAVDHQLATVLVDFEEVAAVTVQGLADALAGILHHNLHTVLRPINDGQQALLIEGRRGQSPQDNLDGFGQMVKGGADGLVHLLLGLLGRFGHRGAATVHQLHHPPRVVLDRLQRVEEVLASRHRRAKGVGDGTFQDVGDEARGRLQGEGQTVGVTLGRCITPLLQYRHQGFCSLYTTKHPYFINYRLASSESAYRLG